MKDPELTRRSLLFGLAAAPLANRVIGAGDDAEVDPPATLSTQPRPVALMVARTAGATAIARTWASAGDVARCQLCPLAECQTDANRSCLVIVPAIVPDEETPMFSLVEHRAGC